MIRFRRRGLALLGTAVLTAATVGAVPAATATAAPAAPRALAAQGTPFGSAGFAEFGTGSELSLSALNTGATQLARVDQAFSATVGAGGGLGPALIDPQTGAVVQPAVSGANATARGSGAEVGLGLTPAQANQIQLGIAQAKAPPPTTVGSIAGPDVSAVPLQIPGVIQTGVLHGFASANYSPSFCPVGQPIGYGLGSAAAPTTVLSTVVASPGAAATSTRSDLVANPDGTFGLQTRVSETIAPLLVTLAGAGTATPTTLEVDVSGTSPSSPVTLTAATDGEGHSSILLGNANPTVTVKLTLAGVAVPPITASLTALQPLLNTLLGPTSALHTLLSGLGLNLSVTLGGTTPASPLVDANGAVVFANGANAISGSYDILALHLSLGSTVVTDLRLGHMEAYAALPNGSIACTVPVAKVASVPNVTAGNSFTWSISIPSSATALADSACDLTNIVATDKIKVNSGSPSFTVGAISRGGTYNASTGTITWPNLGSYHPGDPPIVLTVTVNIPSNSPAGVLQDTANVTAGLGNCTGGVTGITTLIGNVGNVVLGGSITLVAPTVSAGGAGAGLATTGTGPLLPWIAAGLLAMAYATRRLVRRTRRAE